MTADDLQIMGFEPEAGGWTPIFGWQPLDPIFLFRAVVDPATGDVTVSEDGDMSVLWREDLIAPGFIQEYPVYAELTGRWTAVPDRDKAEQLRALLPVFSHTMLARIIIDAKANVPVDLGGMWSRAQADRLQLTLAPLGLAVERSYGV